MPGMSQSPQTLAHVMRASAVTLFTVVVGSLGHLVGGGELPAAKAFAVLYAVLMPLAVPFMGPKRRLVGTLAYMSGTQIAMHTWLCWLTPLNVATHSGHMQGNHHHAAPTTFSPPHIEHLSHGGFNMVAGHVVAGVLIGCFLAYADTLWESALRIVLPFHTWLHPIALRPACQHIPACWVPLLRSSTTNTHAAPRGPPRCPGLSF